MPTPAAINADRRAQALAERLHAKLIDAQSAALDLPPAGTAAVAPFATTPEARLALAEYVLGVIHRAGLATAFRALLVNDALETGDAALCRLAGAPLVREPTPSGPPVKRHVLPSGIPPLPGSEALARELAGRLVVQETARAEAQWPGGVPRG